MRGRTVTLRLSADEISRLDELRAAQRMSRSAIMRGLLRQAAPPPAPTHEEALIMLAESARAGRTAARLALERALRPPENHQAMLDSEIRQLLDDG